MKKEPGMTENADTPPDLEHTASQIAAALGEHDDLPREQIRRIVRHLGSAYASELLAETQAIEEQGGMLVSDGSRRRTPGGIFFWLTRQRLQREGRKDDLRAIFPPRPSGPPPRPSGPPPRRSSPPPLPDTPPIVGQGRPRKKRAGYERPRRRPDTINREEALHRLTQARPNQASILETLESHLGQPPDLYRRSVDPESGAVTLAFHFPQVAQQRYADALEAAAAAAGVPIHIAPQPHQGALMQAAREVLPPGLTPLRAPSLLFEHTQVEVICSGEADDVAVQAAQEQLHATTGWRLDIQVREPGQAAPTTDAAGLLNQRRATDMVRDTLGDACYKISVHAERQTLQVRFFFPDVAREHYAPQLADLAEQTGWQIEVAPETHQGALLETVQRMLPAQVALARTPSVHRDTRQVVAHCQPVPSDDEAAALADAFAAETGWQLVLEGA